MLMVQILTKGQSPFRRLGPTYIRNPPFRWILHFTRGICLQSFLGMALNPLQNMEPNI